MIINRETDKFKEECGIFGALFKNPYDLSSLSYAALSSLQHRGQESCGITFSDGKNLYSLKGMGLVSEVFHGDNFKNIIGKSAIGHVRYSTCGESSLENAQPIQEHLDTMEIAIAHNGNMTNADFYKKELIKEGGCFQTSTDSEVFLKMVMNQKKNTIEESVIETMKKIKGGYAIVMLLADSLIGIRDPKGIRPLCIGKLKDGYIICSESCTIDILGGQFIRDVEPGEIIKVSSKGIESISYGCPAACETCAFEYIYFARPDSIIDGVNVHKSRTLAGKELYKQNPINGDVVIGVPDSGNVAAIGYGKASGIEYEIGLIKNNYIGRTFIQPTTVKREEGLLIKLNVIKDNINGKRVIVVDDSIVRGTTSRKIAEMLRGAGAAEIHFRIASPPIRESCHLGIDTKYKDELLASTKNMDEIKKFMGVDSIEYLTMDSFLKTLENKREVCLKCFGIL